MECAGWRFEFNYGIQGIQVYCGDDDPSRINRTRRRETFEYSRLATYGTVLSGYDATT